MQRPSSDTLRKAVVVAASCVISFLTLGTLKLSGQLFLACREKFDVGRREAALPFVLAFTLKNISGPFVGYLGNKFGLRCVTVLGCAGSAVSLGACYFVEDIITFTVLWGVCLGTGFGLGTTLITNILHNCFKTDFNKVQGIFLASGCLGNFVFPGITEYFLKTLGISGTFLILSGLLLHCIPATMLLKEPKKCKPIKIRSEIKELDDANRMYKEIKTMSIEEISNFESVGVPTKQISQTEYNHPGAKSIELVQFSGSPKQYTLLEAGKDHICEETHFSSKNVLRNVTDLKDETAEVNRSTKQKQSDTESKYEISGSEKHLDASDCKEKNPNCANDTEMQKDIPDSDKQLDASDSKQNTLSVLKLHRQSNSKPRNFQVFLDPSYILILISLSSAAVVLTTMYTVIVDAVRDKDITEDVTVLMTFAISEMLGRLTFGYMADGGRISPLNIYALCCSSCGLLMIGYVWLDNFYVVLVFNAGIGALMGGMIVGPPGIIRNYINKEDITMAFSSRYFLFGLLSLPQPLVIGYFRETLHSYAGLFYLLGSMCILSTIIALLIPSAARLRDRKKSYNKV